MAFFDKLKNVASKVASVTPLGAAGKALGVFKKGGRIKKSSGKRDMFTQQYD
jgi:hypothetical protein